MFWEGKGDDSVFGVLDQRVLITNEAVVSQRVLIAEVMGKETPRQGDGQNENKTIM